MVVLRIPGSRFDGNVGGTVVVLYDGVELRVVFGAVVAGVVVVAKSEKMSVVVACVVVTGSNSVIPNGSSVESVILPSSPLDLQDVKMAETSIIRQITARIRFVLSFTGYTSK